jgi:hypothetical protein
LIERNRTSFECDSDSVNGVLGVEPETRSIQNPFNRLKVDLVLAGQLLAAQPTGHVYQDLFLTISQRVPHSEPSLLQNEA